MPFWSRQSGEKGEPSGARDQSVVIELLLDAMHPSPEEKAKYTALCRELAEAIARSKAGTLAKEDWAGGRFVVTFHGPDAEAIWEAIAPVIEPHPLPHGSRAVKRVGSAGAGDEVIDLGWAG